MRSRSRIEPVDIPKHRWKITQTDSQEFTVKLQYFVFRIGPITRWKTVRDDWAWEDIWGPDAIERTKQELLNTYVKRTR